MPIYTKTGDKGKTSLFNNTRVFKNDKRIASYGTIDELNSFLGICVARIGKPKSVDEQYLQAHLIQIQNDLFSIGSCLADPESLVSNIDIQKKVKQFEKEIDYMTEQMPPLSNFILPGGGKLAAFLHITRAVSRRAEREIVGLSQKESVDEDILVYINRLSDVLFTMARFANHLEGNKETIWQK